MTLPAALISTLTSASLSSASVRRQAWTALVGVGVFLLYPVWRAWYRRSAC